MTKKKLSQVQKLKREVEALKAQVRSEVVQIEKVANPSFPAAVKKISQVVSESSRHTLPIKEIKHDLVRIAIFTVVSLGLIVILGVLRVDVLQALSNVKF